MSDDGSDALAAVLRRRGLAAPARLLLEAHRPLRPLMANLALFLSPMARQLLPRTTDAVQAALDDERRYDRLIRQLEAEDDD